MNSRNTFMSHLWKGAIVLALLVLLIHLAPQETSSFKYYFEVGKPWGYELVTAEFDFPIYKTEAQLKQEEAEVMRDFSPYYMLDESVAGEQLNRLFHNVNGQVTEIAYDTIVALMRQVYAGGIINDQRDLGKAQGIALFCSAKDHILHLGTAQCLAALLAHDP